MINGIMGLAVGDAVGVPYEFKSRKEMKENPATDMAGYGTYNMPEGTWSDDTSLTLCLADSLKNRGYVDYKDIMRNFGRWFLGGKYTATGEVFDVGNMTREAIQKFMLGLEPLECGGTTVDTNGNGSLMRILPMAYRKSTIQEIFNVSSLTHAHPISRRACLYYVFIAEVLKKGEDYESAFDAAELFLGSDRYFHRLPYIHELPEEEINSTGYVVDTLEAALWSLRTTDNYRDCILKAVNLGGDTDTTAAVAGGLAGIKYGVEGIPEDWIRKLKNKELIERICY